MQSYITHAGGKSAQWFAERAHGTYAKVWLFLLSFTESSFFLIPPDPLLIAILLAGAQRWRYYAFLTTAASVLGGIAGYAIGAVLYETVGTYIVSTHNLSSSMETARYYFSETAFFTILGAALTPVPYKLFAIAAGVFKINIAIFIVASIIGRGIRFYALAYIIHRFGPTMLALVSRYLVVITYAAVIILLAYGVYLSVSG